MNFDQLRQAWREAYEHCAQGGQAVLLDAVRAQRPARKSLDEPPTYDPDKGLSWSQMDRRSHLVGRFGLGLGARLRIAIDSVGRIKFAEQMRGVRGPGTRDVGAATKVDGDRPVDITLVEAAIRAFPPQWRTVTAETFEQEAFCGPTAVEEFRRWLMVGERPSTNLTLLGGEENQGLFPGREDLVAKLETFLSADRPKEAPGERDMAIVQVVRGEGLEHGLRALAHHLAGGLQASRKDTRPICFLPVLRYATDSDGFRHAVTTEGLIANLLAFCRSQALPAEPLVGRAQIDAAIAEIRAVMARHPMILILDGWVAQDGPLSGAQSLAVADGVADLLFEIARPRLLIGEAGWSPDDFYHNRILVLTETGPPKLGPIQASEELPALKAPSRDDIEAIATKQGRESPEAIAELCQHDSMLTDAPLAIAQDALARGWTMPLERGRQWRFNLFAQAWLKRLSDEAELDLLVLRFVAVARDGLRIPTLHRLLRRWSMIDADAQKALASAITPAAIETSLATLTKSRVLIRGRDAAIPGLDDFEWSHTGLNEPIGARPDDPATALRFVDLPAGAIRAEIIDHLRRSATPSDLPRMHRLLAEDALEQHTTLSRLGDWRESNLTAAYYRRLVQALLHGFASFSADSPKTDEALRPTPRNLPLTQTEAYRRLYSVYFRGLMERPPEWELSRILGREDLKSELILLAMNAGEEALFGALHGAGQDLAPIAPGLLKNGGSDRREGDEAIEFDQALGLARSAFHNNKIALATSALAYLNTFKPSDADLASTEGKLRLAKITKVRADLEMIGEPKKLRELDLSLGADLRRLGFDGLDTLESCWRAGVADSDGDPEPDDAKLKIKTVDGVASALVDDWVDAAAPSPRLMIAWSDVLSRVAEARSLLASAGTESGLDIDEGLVSPFVIMLAAERLRRRAFRVAPLSRIFYVNGHSTRVLVRIVLRMIAAIDNPPKGVAAADLARLPERAALADMARFHIDLISRYLSRLPTERVSLLVMESQYHRLVEGGLNGHRRALSYLMLADRLLPHVRQRPRVTLRFAHERCQVLKGLYDHRAELTEAEGFLAEQWRLSALQDARWQLTLGSQTPSWLAATKRVLVETQADCALDGQGAAPPKRQRLAI